MTEINKILIKNNKSLIKTKKIYFRFFIIYSILLLIILFWFWYYIYNQKKYWKIYYKPITKTAQKIIIQKIKPNFTNSILYNNINKKCIIIPTKDINKLLKNKTIKSWLSNKKYSIYNIKKYIK